MTDVSSAVGRYADDLRSQSYPPELAQALRDLVEPPPEPAADVDVARNVNLTFCWADPNGIAASDECPALAIDFPCRISGWRIYGKRSETGSAVFSVFAGIDADYPAPASIVASAKPTISGASHAIGDLAAVSTWDRVLPRGAVLVANPDSISGFTKITLSLRAKRLDL